VAWGPMLRATASVGAADRAARPAQRRLRRVHCAVALATCLAAQRRERGLIRGGTSDYVNEVLFRGELEDEDADIRESWNRPGQTVVTRGTT